MKKQILIALLFIVILSNVIYAQEDLPPSADPIRTNFGVFKVKEANIFDKLLCGINLKECAESNIGKIIFIKEKQLYPQQILGDGTRKPGYILKSGATEVYAKQGESIGFCGGVAFEDPDNKCNGVFNEAIYNLLVDNEQIPGGAVRLSGTYKIGIENNKQFCMVKTLDQVKDYKYTYFTASAMCKPAYANPVNQGSKTFLITVHSTSATPTETCTAQWNCLANSQNGCSNSNGCVRYQNSDCSYQDIIWKCDYGCTSGKCDPKPQVDLTPPEEIPEIVPAVCGDNVCDSGEDCSCQDCASDTVLCSYVDPNEPSNPLAPTDDTATTTIKEPPIISKEQKGLSQSERLAITISALIVLIGLGIFLYFKYFKKRRKR